MTFKPGVNNYSIAHLQLEEIALKYGAMCASCSSRKDPAAQRKAYDSALEHALHYVARALYAASKSTEGPP